MLVISLFLSTPWDKDVWPILQYSIIVTAKWLTFVDMKQLKLDGKGDESEHALLWQKSKPGRRWAAWTG